jgi:hypothetical protein
MRPRDWFLVAIRVLGVYVLWRGVMDLTTFLEALLRLMPDTIVNKDFGGSIEKATMNYLLYAAVHFAFAIYVIFGGEGFTKWAFDEYPREADDGDEGDSRL